MIVLSQRAVLVASFSSSIHCGTLKLHWRDAFHSYILRNLAWDGIQSYFLLCCFMIWSTCGGRLKGRREMPEGCIVCLSSLFSMLLSLVDTARIRNSTVCKARIVLDRTMCSFQS